MNKYSILFIISVFVGITAQADIWKNQKGLCMTSPFPSTTFAFNTTTDQKVKVSVVHHNGLGYAPFWDSQIVAEDLKMLTDKSKVILELDSELHTSWSAKDCQWSGPQKVACVGTADKVKMKSKTIEPWAFYSAVLKESSFAGDFTYIQTTLLFYIDGQKYIFVSKYPESDCEFSENIL